MTTTVLRVACPDCGPHIEVPLASCVITVHDGHATAICPCPVCTVPTTASLSAMKTVQLVYAGVPIVNLPPRKVSDQPTVTAQEVVRFAMQLVLTDDLAGTA